MRFWKRMACLFDGWSKPIFSALVCYQQPSDLFTISMTKQNDTLCIFRMLKQSVECQFIFRFERNQRQILVTGWSLESTGAALRINQSRFQLRNQNNMQQLADNRTPEQSIASGFPGSLMHWFALTIGVKTIGKWERPSNIDVDKP